MTTGTSSADLADMAARAPELAAANKLRLFDALYITVPDVLIDENKARIEEALEIAALTGAPFVSLDLDVFDSSLLLDNLPDDLDYDDSSPAGKNLQRLVKSVRKHDGENEQLWLRWASMGLSYGWTVRADWRQKLAVDMEKANIEISQESTTRAQARNVEIESLVALLTESPDFRAAQANKRNPIGFAIVAASPDHKADHDVIDRAISRAGIQAERRAFELELSLKPNMDELAEDLCGTADWRAATTIAMRLEATGKYLRTKAEGYRQSVGFVESMMRAAKYLDDNPPMD